MKEAAGSWTIGICQTADILRNGYKALGERFMKRLHITAAAFLLSAAVLLGGCTGQQVDNSTDINLSSKISENSGFAQSESLQNSTSNYESSVSEPENSNGSDNNLETVSTPDYSHLNIPTEFTDEDRELQKILTDLVSGANEICRWFNSSVASERGDLYKFVFPESVFPEIVNIYCPIPDNYITYDGTSLVVPTTRAKMVDLIHKFISSEASEDWIEQVQTGKMTEISDGIFSVTGIGVDFRPHFIELNGRLYCFAGDSTKILPINCKTAKVKSKTEDTISFTYLGYSYVDDFINFPEYSYNADGVLKLESDGWKLDYFYISGFDHD